MCLKHLFLCTLVMFLVGICLSCLIWLFQSFNCNCNTKCIFRQSECELKHTDKLFEKLIEQHVNFLYSSDKSNFKIRHQNINDETFLIRTLKFHTKPKACEEIPTTLKFDCLPLSEFLSEHRCISVGCCWDTTVGSYSNISKSSPIPFCYFPSNYAGYQVHNVCYKENGIDATLERITPSGLPKDIPKLKFMVRYIGVNTLNIKITDASSPRYEVPLPLLRQASPINFRSLSYNVSLSHSGILEVARKNPRNKIFFVNLSKLLFADQLLQLSSDLSSHYIYGLADHMGSFLKSTNWSKFTFFNSDTIPEVNKNLYSSFPFYLMMEEQGSSHGVLFFNSNALDIILQPKPAITFRAVGGILDFFIFLGPSPGNVVQEYSELIGYPILPPYWSLGFHLCRLGYLTLNNTLKVLRRTIKAKIPFDTQWNDIDHMKWYNDFTYDKINFKHLPEFVRNLHDLGMHYVLITDPAISNAEKPGSYPPFDDGLKMDIFVKNSSGKILTTKVWNKVSSVFPDFTNPAAMDYWHKQLNLFHSEIQFDGIWLDMNEPTNFLNGSFFGCPSNSSLEHPPYVPGGNYLSTKTLCMSAIHNVSYHYNVHNMYGILQTKATYRALLKIRKKRPFIVTRAGFPGIGHYSAMWNGDVLSTWEHLRASIPSMLGFSINGVPMSGSDICGFNGNTTVELCARWSTLGAFYPFSRNHNSDENIDQDPVALGKSVILAAKFSLSLRYYLLPYLYTLFYFSHTRGDTVARPLFFEFPHDNQSFKIDYQFMWGPALLITPVLEPSAMKVTGYFPEGVWYNFCTKERIFSRGEYFSVDVPSYQVNLAVRCGHILPCQIPSATTVASRKNGFVLVVALCSKGNAYGELFWDDGDSVDVIKTGYYNLIKFSADKNKFTSQVIHNGYPTLMNVAKFQISGVNKEPKHVLVNEELSAFMFEPKNKFLQVQNISVTLMRPIIVKWK